MFTRLLVALLLSFTFFTANAEMENETVQTPSALEQELLTLAEQAIDHFHQQFNDKAFDKIYDEAGREIQHLNDKDDIVKMFRSIHQHMGPISESHRLGTQAQGLDEVAQSITLIYETHFAEGKGWEKFMVTKRDDKPVIIYYYLNSQDYMDKVQPGSN